MNKKFRQALAGGLVITMCATSFVSAIDSPIEVEAKKSTTQLAGEQVSYLENTIRKNYLGQKNLNHFNTQLRKAKSMVGKIPSGSTKRSLSSRVSVCENVIRATESTVKLEDSMNKNSHTLSSVPTFEIYINNANKYINRIPEGIHSSAKVGLSKRSYSRFNNIRDIKVKNTIEYSYANQLYNEASMLYQKALANSTKDNVAAADIKVSEALKAVYAVSTSVIKDKLRGNIKVLINKVSKLPGSGITGGGSGGSGGGGSTLPPVDLAKPTIRLNGAVNNYINKNDKFIDPGYTATDSVDGDITYKVQVTYQQNGKPISSINTSTEGTYMIVYTVTNSRNKTQTTYRWLTVGAATNPGGGGSGGSGGSGGNTGSDVTPPVITLKGDSRIFVKYGGTFTDPGYTATDNVDGASVRVEQEIYYNNYQKVTFIDTRKAGFYSITYKATDRAGNKTEVVRTVTVEEINADSDGSVIMSTIDGINVDLKVAANLTSPDEIKYVQGDELRGIKVSAASSKAYIEIKGNNASTIASGTGAVEYTGNLADYDELTIVSRSADYKDIRYYKVKLTRIGAGDNVSIARAILESDNIRQVYKVLLGAYPGIVNKEWENSYVKEVSDGKPGIVIVKGSGYNKVYSFEGTDMRVDPSNTVAYNIIRDTLFDVNDRRITDMDKTSKDSFIQAQITEATSKYLRDGVDKTKRVNHSKAKEHLFKMVEATDGKTIRENLINYIRLDVSPLQLGTNLETKDISEYLDSEYYEVLNDTNGSIRNMIRNLTIGLEYNKNYPNIKSLIVDSANSKAIVKTISSITSLKSSMNTEGCEGDLRNLLTRLENVTKHRRETTGIDKKVFKPLGDKTLDYTMKQETDKDPKPGVTSEEDNYYYYDVNYKKYIDQIIIALGGKTDSVVAVENGIREANKLAKKENSEDLNEIIRILKNSPAVLTDDNAEDLLAMLYKVSDRIPNATTKKFRELGSTSDIDIVKRKEIAQVLRDLIAKDTNYSGDKINTLTIKKLIANSSRLDLDSRSNFIIQNAMDTYESQLALFESLETKMLTTYKYQHKFIETPNQGGDVDNSQQWLKLRRTLIDDIRDYISNAKLTLEWRTPGWDGKFEVNETGSSKAYTDNEYKITHFILYNNELLKDSNNVIINQSQYDLVQKLKSTASFRSGTSVKGIDAIMNEIVTEAMK
ncbi:MAG: DUF5011 domain-containing protein, partial [Clostridium sp.]